MNTLGSLKDNKQDFQRPLLEQRRQSSGFTLAVVCLLIAAIVGFTYFAFFRQTAQSPAGEARQQKEAPVSTEAQIFEDEPVPKGSQAIVGGTVRNISREPLRDLSLELELKRRVDGSTELRTVAVEPNDLAPGEEGKYTLTLQRQEFSETQIKRLKSNARSEQIVFKTAPGAPRPKELPHEPPTRTIIVQRPSSTRPKGEEFINTPDTPTKIP
jgi:hypothetical protein